MPKPGRIAGLVVALALVAAALTAAVAVAAETITARPDADDFAADEYFGDLGDVFTYSAAGATTGHDVTAFTKGPDGRPLFRSRTIPSGTTPVDGTQYLTAGTYRFSCSVHGPTMQSKLTIEQKGQVAARPDIELTVPQQSLASVRSSGKLKVRVEAKTVSRSVSLLAKKGGRSLGSKPKLNLPSGAKRTVAIPLTGAGRKALQDIEAAFVSVKGMVPFGAPDTARRKLK